MSSTPSTGKKERLGTSVRGALNEQLSRIQLKHVAELELMEEIKSFLKQRAQIERDYSQSLQKLVCQYLGRHEAKTPPEVTNFNRHENRGIVEIWMALLSKTEELGKKRTTVADLLSGTIIDDLKNLKREKEQVFKRQSETFHTMISEVLESIRDLTTSKKLYNDKWKLCEDSRQKFQELTNRLHQSNFKMFESKATLERTEKKASEKLKISQKQLVVHRNDYLLSLSETNAHLAKHFGTDIPETLKVIDGDFYDKIRNAYVLYAQIEIDNMNALRAEFEDLREQANLVNREYVTECFLMVNSVLSNKIVYQFDPMTNDKVSSISRDHEVDLYLNKEARKWSQQLTKLHQRVTERNKTIKGLQSVTQAYHTNPEFGTGDALAEAKMKLMQEQEVIRQLEVKTTKVNARLDILKDHGIDVNKWLQQAAHTGGEYTPGERRRDNSQTQPDLLDLNSTQPRALSLSLSSLKTDGDSYSLISDASINSYQSDPILSQCKALYTYQAQRSDELTIATDDELEVIEWDNGDGWCKGRNPTSGCEGYFPQSYVQAISRPSSPNVDPTAKTTGQVMLRALFEYTAQEDEELSFPAGAILSLLKTNDNGVDDGWWEGSYNGKVGVFPSVVVEKILNESMQDLTPVNSVIFPFVSPETSPTPAPPPPSYPAPEISANDLSILPLRQLQQNLSSSSLPSLHNHHQQHHDTIPYSNTSSPRVHRGSAVISQANRNSQIMDCFQNSFEDTLRSDGNNNWSSFDDDSYV